MSRKIRDAVFRFANLLGCLSGDAPDNIATRAQYVHTVRD